jgi:predicted porin
MQKKLMAIAVAGALGAPAVALAQASTVQVYGQITYEYGWAKQADAVGGSRPNVDYADTPGGSAIGFRGEEKLGGGLSAWFQCESSADVRGMDQTGLCTRNSAVGFKGGFGNIHFGRWDTPMKRALNVGTVGAEETGLLGMSFLPFGGSGGADATNSGDGPVRQRWKRREAGLAYYESPKFGGFQVLAAFSSGNAAADNNVLDNDIQQNQKPRVISLAGIYSAGPLGIGIAYERHNEFGLYAPISTQSADDRGWGASISYKFGPVEVGATYLDTKYDTLPGQGLKKKTATVGVEWAIAGPHSVEAQYAWADDSEGNSTVGIAGAGTNGALNASGSDTGGDAISLAYRYRFSKRTSIKLGYVLVDNDANATTYRVGNTAGPAAPGEKSSAVAFHIRHRF